MKYVFNKKIFYINLFLGCLLLFFVVYSEGLNVMHSRTEIISCPEDAKTPCKIRMADGENLYLDKGQEITLNKFNDLKLNITNYGIWLLIAISVTINHIKYNKNYPIKYKIKKMLSRLKQ